MVVRTVASPVDGKGDNVKVTRVAFDSTMVLQGNLIRVIEESTATEGAKYDMAHTSLNQSLKLRLDARFHLLICIHICRTTAGTAVNSSRA